MEEVKKLANSFVGDCLISIKLEDGGRFTVQRATLCAASEYFRNALSGAFLETETKTLRLPDCTTDSFELIIYWLVHSRLPDLYESLRDGIDMVPLIGLDQAYELRKTRAYDIQAKLVRLWIQCDMLLMPILQNDTLRQLEPFVEECVGLEATQITFELTPDSSPLRGFLIEWFTWQAMPITHDRIERHDDEVLQLFGIIPGFFPAIVAAMFENNDRTEPDLGTYLVPEG